MAFCCCPLTKIFELILIYGYPAYKVLKSAKDGQLEKLWIIYFLIIGLFSILEGTILLCGFVLLFLDSYRLNRQFYEEQRLSFQILLLLE